MKAEMRQRLAQLPFEKKIRKVGELIRLRQKIKTDVSNISDEAVVLASLDAGKGVPSEDIRRTFV